jgi:hypothetical protein
MSDAKTYTGSCHCGNVRYEARIALGKVIACNCSICSRKGVLMAFIGEDAFKLLSGEDALKDYQFNKHRIHHLFCSLCGIHAHGRGTRPDGTPMVMINVRCLDGVDPLSLEVQHFDGKSP